VSATKVAVAAAKPFLKWAGGKSQMLDQYRPLYPEELKSGEIASYVEPFLGGAAVFFDVAQRYRIKSAWLSDANEEVILAYKVVQTEVDALIRCLKPYAEKYKLLPDDERARFFYDVRACYNRYRRRVNHERQSKGWIRRAAQLIFLNRTCFNGLFRLNRKGEFNVPFGKYKNPRILDEANLRRASQLLQTARIGAADFENVNRNATSASFIYLDPPYRPISATSSFTSYSGNGFDDDEQLRLSRLFRELTELGAKVMLSNSDPRNVDPHDDFIDKLYSGYRIRRVLARRAINSDRTKRGHINEVVITNY
jgi:DNA adenine methylase